MENVVGIDWDEGNWPKCGKHGVSKEEIESLFARGPMILRDPYPSEIEVRFNAVGRTQSDRPLFVAFTVRRDGDEPRVRPISARYMHEKEVQRYEKTRKT